MFGDGLPPPPRSRDQEPAQPALCPQCGRDVPVMEALVYHGLVYHPTCVLSKQEGSANGQEPSRP